MLYTRRDRWRKKEGNNKKNLGVKNLTDGCELLFKTASQKILMEKIAPPNIKFVRSKRCNREGLVQVGAGNSKLIYLILVELTYSPTKFVISIMTLK